VDQFGTYGKIATQSDALGRVDGLLAAGAWIYRFEKVRAAESKDVKEATLDLRFTAPIGYEFCTGKICAVPHLRPANTELRGVFANLA